ncbi:MAG: YfcE family phosphodiesterase [Gemmatimonadaceae bacterium]
MRIGLIGDTHDRVPAIAELTRRMVAGGVSMVLHAGDFCSPFSLAPFSEHQVSLIGVFGRNDGDREGLRGYAGKLVGVELFESPHSYELERERILIVHDLGEVARRSVEQHTLVVHGCSHRQEVKSRGETLLVNPGEACGWLYGAPTAAIIDLATKDVEVLRLSEPEWKF